MESTKPLGDERGSDFPKKRPRAGLARFIETALLRLLAAVTIFAVWEGVVRAGWTSEFWISSPTAIAGQLRHWVLNDHSIVGHTATTIGEAICGLLLGGGIGVAAGLALFRWERLRVALDPFIIAVYSMPRIALAPLFILWFGIGLTSKIILAGFVVFFILLINTLVGAQSVDPDLINSVRTMGAKRGFLFRRVILPGMLGWILSGFRSGLGLAITGAVVAEIVASRSGIGWLIVRAQGGLDTTTIFSALIVLAVSAMILNEIMRRIEARLLRWQGTATL